MTNRMKIIGFFLLFNLGIFLTVSVFAVPDLGAVTIPKVDSDGKPVDVRKKLKKDPDLYLEEMKVSFKRGDLDLAGYIAMQMLSIRPNDTDVRAIFSISLSAKGQLEKAKEQLRHSQAGGKNMFHTLCAEAILLRLKKKYNEAVKTCQKAISKDKSHPYPLNILGRIYLEQGEYKKALEYFQKAVKLVPEFLPGYSNLGATAFLLKDHDRALKYFQKAISLKPNSYSDHYGLSLVLESVGRYQPAIKALQKCLKINPGNPVSLKKLGEIQLKAGQYKAALSTGKEMEKLGIAGAYEILANTALHLGNPKGAKNYIDKIPEKGPGADYLLGFSLMAEGQYKKALDQMEKTLQKDPNHFGAYTAVKVLKMYMGNDVLSEKKESKIWGANLNKFLDFLDATVLATQNNWAGAMDKWRSAEGLIQGFSLSGIDQETMKKGTTIEELKYLNMGTLYFFRNLHELALSEFNKALEQNRDSILANYWAAQIYLKKRKRQEALECYQKTIKNAPKFFTALYAIGELNFLLGNATIAEEYYNRALSVKKDAGIYLKLGLLYEKAKAYEKAEKAYQEMIKVSPKFYVGYNQLAWLYAKRGVKLDKATSMVKKADELMPGNASILDTKGWIQYHKQNYEKSLENLKQSNKIKPNNPTVLYHLGAVFHSMGNSSEARKHLEKALEISSDFEDAEEARKLLEK